LVLSLEKWVQPGRRTGHSFYVSAAEGRSGDGLIARRARVPDNSEGREAKRQKQKEGPARPLAWRPRHAGNVSRRDSAGEPFSRDYPAARSGLRRSDVIIMPAGGGLRLSNVVPEL